jgi:hypothetical protein
MGGILFYFFFKIKRCMQEDVDENAPIICSKKISICCQERFEKYCGSILVLSILDAETSSV